MSKHGIGKGVITSPLRAPEAFHSSQLCAAAYSAYWRCSYVRKRQRDIYDSD
jgi:hypothetical protein